jgi:hypothetical protein
MSKFFLFSIDTSCSCRQPNDSGKDWIANLGNEMSWRRHLERWGFEGVPEKRFNVKFRKL